MKMSTPGLAKRLAIARPMPLVPPVIRTAITFSFPFSGLLQRSHFWFRWSWCPTSLYDKDVGRATSRTRAGAKDRRGTERPDFLVRCAFGIGPKPSARPRLAFIGRELPAFTSGSRRVRVLITADFEPADLVAVHFVRSIREAQETRRRERGCKEMIVRCAPAAKELDGPVD